MNVLFLHTPKFHNYYRPVGSYSFIMYPPMGLFGLADFLKKHEHSARIVHLGVEDRKYGSIDFEKVLSDHPSPVVGLDLHWHFQSYDVIEVARKIKQAHPEIAILLGGFTASIFAEEILRDFPFVDFVIRGDAEVPLLRLVQRFQSDKNYADVPNLAYREDSRVVLNPTTYLADGAMLDSLCFSDFTIMKDYRYFIDHFSHCSRHSTELSESTQRLASGRRKRSTVYIGRGCVHNCSYCGGSAGAHFAMCGRRCVAMRSADKVLESIQDLAQFGFELITLALDCLPPQEVDDFYVPIFEGLARLDLTVDIEVERFSLPTMRFLESFQRLKGKGSFITLSPHTPNEELRRKNGMFRYSNRDFEACLDAMEKMGIGSQLGFTCGLPFETRKDLEDLDMYHRRLRKRYKKPFFAFSLIEIEPGSPMSRHPEAFGIRPERATFAEYYRYHGFPKRNYILEMGYSRSDCPSHDQVSTFFCRHFCDRSNLGPLAPVICRLRGKVWRSGVIQAVDRLLASKRQEPAS